MQDDISVTETLQFSKRSSTTMWWWIRTEGILQTRSCRTFETSHMSRQTDQPNLLQNPRTCSAAFIGHSSECWYSLLICNIPKWVWWFPLKWKWTTMRTKSRTNLGKIREGSPTRGGIKPYHHRSIGHIRINSWFFYPNSVSSLSQWLHRTQTSYNDWGHLNTAQITEARATTEQNQQNQKQCVWVMQSGLVLFWGGSGSGQPLLLCGSQVGWRGFSLTGCRAKLWVEPCGEGGASLSSSSPFDSRSLICCCSSGLMSFSTSTRTRRLVG